MVVVTRTFFEDDGGFSTLGMVIALLITLALVFSTAQVYRVMSASADVQDVADAAALAAENEVAEFMIAVRLCDAISLSLSLTALVAMGLGTAALCNPVTASASEVLLSSAKKVISARNAFAQKATKGLNSIQKALPYLSAAQAMAVCLANNSASSDAQYFGVAMLVNSEGEEIEVPELEGAEELEEQIDEQKDDIQAASEEAEKAATEANEAKEIAYENDCGYFPAYCMGERAEALAGLSCSKKSFRDWTFATAFNRAKAYYKARLDRENPAAYSSVEEQASSALRQRFYEYAVSKMNEGYVFETDDAFQAYFPLLPKNISDLKETELYTEAVYPVTESGDVQTMHAYAGCPNAAGAMRNGSIEELDEGEFEMCPLCTFEVQSMGHIAAASTSTESGFEHYYAIVAEQAERYEKAYGELEPQTSAVKEKVSPLIDSCKKLADQAAACRISAEPPGSYGAIALVVNTQSVPASRGFENAFVESGATLGARAAVSGATIIEDDSSEGGTVISNFLNGVKGEMGLGGGVATVVLDVWSTLLSAYGAGQEALSNAVSEALKTIGVRGSLSGLGDWVSQRFTDAMEKVGLQPAKLNALKPVTVNSGSVAEGGSDVFSASFLSVKKKAQQLSGGGEELFSSIVKRIGNEAFEALGIQDGQIVIAEISLLGTEGTSIPITIPLPQAVSEVQSGLLESAEEALRTLVRSVTGTKVWE